MSQQLREMIEHATSAVHAQTEQVSLILLHPESRYRSLVVAQLLKSSVYPAYYYAFGANDTSLQVFARNFAHTMSEQKPSFGRLLRHAGYTHEENSASQMLLEALIHELEMLHDEPYLLILDEFDWVDVSEPLFAFWEKVIHRLPQHCTLILNTRTVPRLSWLTLQAAGQCAILRDTTLVNRIHSRETLSIDDSSQAKVEIYGFGSGRITLDDRPLENWEGHLPRLLLFLVLDRPSIRRSEICRILWPELAEDQAVNVFHVTKRRLHKAFGRDILQHRDTFYEIASDVRIHYDVEDFVESIMQARISRDAQERVDLLQRSSTLYNGDFLPGHSDPWVVQRREIFRSVFAQTLIQLTDHYLSEERYDAALETLLPAVQRGDLSHLHYRILWIYEQSGQHSAGIEYLDELNCRWGSRGLTLPEEIQDLAARLRQ